VLPILHLNGYKIANPTVLARIPADELSSLRRGYGHAAHVVEGDDPSSCTSRWPHESGTSARHGDGEEVRPPGQQAAGEVGHAVQQSRRRRQQWAYQPDHAARLFDELRENRCYQRARRHPLLRRLGRRAFCSTVNL
jgi:hypothetical protein